ncbi:hypothetical protein [Scytonema sp. PCC 10023]|uniref:hypothetical protein n=1 Tax=Scytonema sp. PCC 10023 TaxID=1680591 RepID=UPI0039C66A53
MIISDISHIEVAAEDNQVLGGAAFADAYSSGNANGTNFASTYTSTYTSARSGYTYFPFYTSPNSANSGSTSSSSAA